MESLKNGTINMNGGREKNKRAVLSKYITYKNINITILQGKLIVIRYMR